jgi:hypothetical protein
MWSATGPADGVDDLGALLRDQNALEKLTPIVYEELHRLAHLYMKRERPGHSLQTTALVNEAYLRRSRTRSRWPTRWRRLMRPASRGDAIAHLGYRARGGTIDTRSNKDADKTPRAGQTPHDRSPRADRLRIVRRAATGRLVFRPVLQCKSSNGSSASTSLGCGDPAEIIRL